MIGNHGSSIFSGMDEGHNTTATRAGRYHQGFQDDLPQWSWWCLDCTEPFHKEPTTATMSNSIGLVHKLRTQSKPIPIPIRGSQQEQRQKQNDEEQQQQFLQRQYDRTTWELYYRIQRHRRYCSAPNCPLQPQQQQQQQHRNGSILSLLMAQPILLATESETAATKTTQDMEQSNEFETLADMIMMFDLEMSLPHEFKSSTIDNNNNNTNSPHKIIRHLEYWTPPMTTRQALSNPSKTIPHDDQHSQELPSTTTNNSFQHGNHASSHVSLNNTQRRKNSLCPTTFTYTRN